MRFINGRIVEPERVLDKHDLLVEDGRIAAIVPAERARGAGGPETVDLRGNYCCPGFIDTHIHGMHAYHVKDLKTLPDILRILPEGGTTACAPTIGFLRRDEYPEWFAAVRDMIARPPAGAIIVGGHAETPYINPQCICIDAEYLWDPQPAEYEAWLDRSGKGLLEITLSPELPGGMGLVRALAARGRVASIGHSLASEEQVAEAVACGLKTACHLFDNVAVKFFSKDDCLRVPRMDEFVLLHDSLCAELIPDGIHVAPGYVKLLRKCKGPDRVVLVSDAQVGAGLPEGIFHLPDGRPYRVKEGDVARLVESLQIVGSTLTMNRAVAGYMRHGGAGLAEAVRAASLNPARLLGVGEEMGSLEPGKRANMTVLDADCRVQATWVDGKQVYP